MESETEIIYTFDGYVSTKAFNHISTVLNFSWCRCIVLYGQKQSDYQSNIRSARTISRLYRVEPNSIAKYSSINNFD